MEDGKYDKQQFNKAFDSLLEHGIIRQNGFKIDTVTGELRPAYRHVPKSELTDEQRLWQISMLEKYRLQLKQEIREDQAVLDAVLAELRSID